MSAGLGVSPFETACGLCGSTISTATSWLEVRQLLSSKIERLESGLESSLEPFSARLVDAAAAAFNKSFLVEGLLESDEKRLRPFRMDADVESLLGGSREFLLLSF